MSKGRNSMLSDNKKQYKLSVKENKNNTKLLTEISSGSESEVDSNISFTMPGNSTRKLRILRKDAQAYNIEHNGILIPKSFDKSQKIIQLQKRVTFADLDAVYGSTPENTTSESNETISHGSKYHQNVYQMQDVGRPNTAFKGLSKEKPVDNKNRPSKRKSFDTNKSTNTLESTKTNVSKRSKLSQLVSTIPKAIQYKRPVKLTSVESNGSLSNMNKISSILPEISAEVPQNVLKDQQNKTHYSVTSPVVILSTPTSSRVQEQSVHTHIQSTLSNNSATGSLQYNESVAETSDILNALTLEDYQNDFSDINQNSLQKENVEIYSDNIIPASNRDAPNSNNVNILAFPGKIDDQNPFQINNAKLKRFQEQFEKITENEYKGEDNKELEEYPEERNFIDISKIHLDSIRHTAHSHSGSDLSVTASNEVIRDTLDEIFTEQIPNKTVNVFYTSGTNENVMKKDDDKELSQGKISSKSNKQSGDYSGPKGLLIFVNKKTAVKSPEYDYSRRFDSPPYESGLFGQKLLTPHEHREKKHRKRRTSLDQSIPNKWETEPEHEPDSVNKPRDKTGREAGGKYSKKASDKGVTVEKSPSGLKTVYKYPCGCVRIITTDPNNKLETEELITSSCKKGSLCEVQHPELERTNKVLESNIGDLLSSCICPNIEIVADGIISRKKIAARAPAQKMKGANLAASMNIIAKSDTRKLKSNLNFYLDPRLLSYVVDNIDEIQYAFNKFRKEYKM